MIFGWFRRVLVGACRVPPGCCRDAPPPSGTHSAGSPLAFSDLALLCKSHETKNHFNTSVTYAWASLPSSRPISGPSKSRKSLAGSRKREAAKALTPATATKEVQRRNQALQALSRSARGAPLERPRASASKKSRASADHRPPTSIAVTTNWHLALSRSSGYLHSLRRLASARLPISAESSRPGLPVVSEWAHQCCPLPLACRGSPASRSQHIPTAC